MRDLAALGDVVVLAVKPVLAPLQEKLAVFEARLLGLAAYEQALTEIRERVVVVETKSAQPLAEPSVVDLGPLSERMAAIEARVDGLPSHESSITELRDRVVTVEIKAAQVVPAPVVMELGPVLERLAALETTQAMLGELWERRMAVVETKAAQPMPVSLPDPAIGELRDRLLVLETKSLAVPERGEPGPPGAPGVDGVNGKDADPSLLADVQSRLSALEQSPKHEALTKEFTELHERVAVMEVRAQIPGPAGKDGVNGIGKDGKDGADGMGWDDLSVKHDGERTFTVQLIKGERVKDAGTFTMPVMIYRGVFIEGKTYEPGDTVSYGGSVYHCKKTTVLKPDTIAEYVNGEPRGDQGRNFWTMVVRAGREGKQGLPGTPSAPSTLPVVSVGGKR